MNIHKKILLGLSVLMLVSPFARAATGPCVITTPGVLNVGFLPGNLPFSDYDVATGSVIGFDPMLISQAAKLLGYTSVNFIGYGSNALALAALTAGDINVYVNSGRTLSVPPTSYIGVVTDISSLAEGLVSGWVLNIACCTLALQLEAAVTQLVANGVYAQILQNLRLNDQTGGDRLGVPNFAGFVTSPTGLGGTGVLLEPFAYASSEVGTIPTSCVTGPIGAVSLLPQTNCISAYLQSVYSLTGSFTGATGPITP